MKKIVSALLVSALVAGAAVAQDAEAWTFSVGGKVRSGVRLDLDKVEADEHIMSDDDGKPEAVVEFTWKKADLELLFGLSRVDRTYFRVKYGSFDNTNYGAAMQIWDSGNLLSVGKVKSYAFAQTPNKKIIIDGKYQWEGNTGSAADAVETDWDVFVGGLWTAPTDLLSDQYSTKRGLGVQFKMVPGLNFGFSLAPFGNQDNVKNYLAHTTVGAKFEKGLFAVAAGFTPEDREFNGAKLYAGAKIGLMGDKLKIYANTEVKNFGDFGDTGRMDLAAKVSYATGPFEAGVIAKELNLLDNRQDNKVFHQYAEVYAQYAIIPNVFLAKLKLAGDFGLGDANKDVGQYTKSGDSDPTKINQISIEPTVVWSIKGDKVAGDLDDIDVGLIAGYKWVYGFKADNGDGKTTDNMLMLGFKVAF